MKYRSIPTEVEAVQWTGDNLEELMELAGGSVHADDITDGFGGLIGTTVSVLAGPKGAQGWVPLNLNEWLIKGGNPAHYWPCDDETFQQRYEPVSAVVEGSWAPRTSDE